MDKPRLIDANHLKPELEYYLTEKMSDEWNAAIITGIDEINRQTTIDPETLPIVKELRAKLAQVTAERDALKENPPVQIDADFFELAAELAQVTAERNAAVMDVKTLVFGKIKACSYCRHNDPENFDCPMDKNLRYCDSWEWRGPKKEGSNE